MCSPFYNLLVLQWSGCTHFLFHLVKKKTLNPLEEENGFYNIWMKKPCMSQRYGAAL